MLSLRDAEPLKISPTYMVVSRTQLCEALLLLLAVFQGMSHHKELPLLRLQVDDSSLLFLPGVEGGHPLLELPNLRPELPRPDLLHLRPGRGRGQQVSKVVPRLPDGLPVPIDLTLNIDNKTRIRRCHDVMVCR